MTALETAIAIPLTLWLVFSLLLSAPRIYSTVETSARESVQTTRTAPATRPDGWIRIGLVLGDSAALLSGWIPGIGEALTAFGGQREGA